MTPNKWVLLYFVALALLVAIGLSFSGNGIRSQNDRNEPSHNVNRKPHID